MEDSFAQIETQQTMLENVWTGFNMFGRVRICLDRFEHVWTGLSTCLDRMSHVWNGCHMFRLVGHVYTLWCQLDTLESGRQVGCHCHMLTGWNMLGQVGHVQTGWNMFGQVGTVYTSWNIFRQV